MLPEQRRATWDGNCAGTDQHRIQPARSPGAQRRPPGQQERPVRTGPGPAAGALRPQHRRPPEQPAPQARHAVGRPLLPADRLPSRLPADPRIAMGRLFWKFFLSILLAQVAATIGIGGTIWLRDQARQRSNEPTLDLGPPAVIMLDAAGATLRHGGVDGLRDLAANSRRMRLYVLDDQGKELLGRTVPAKLREEVERNLQTGAQAHAVARLVAPDGRRYLAFASRIPGQRPGTGRRCARAWICCGGQGRRWAARAADGPQAAATRGWRRSGTRPRSRHGPGRAGWPGRLVRPAAGVRAPRRALAADRRRHPGQLPVRRPPRLVFLAPDPRPARRLRSRRRGRPRAQVRRHAWA
jgi:hypothetical protein